MRRIGWAVACLAAMAIMLTAVSAADAASRVAWSLPSGTAGETLTFTWRATTPRGGHVAVQRQEGTGHVWRTFLRLRGNAGQGGLPANAIGSYLYRIAVFSHTNRLVADQTRTAHYWGEVPIGTLLPATTATYNDPSSEFPFSFSESFNYGCAGCGTGLGTDVPLFTAVGDICSSVDLSYVIGDLDSGSWQSEGDDSFAVEILHQSSDPTVQAPVAFNQPGVIAASTPPGQTWGLELIQNPNNWGYQHNGTIGTGYGDRQTIFVDGTAYCDSTNEALYQFTTQNGSWLTNN